VKTASPLTRADDGVRVALRVTPKARRTRVDGLIADADGGIAVKLSVTAAPEDGKANAAVVGLLAREWRVPKSAIEIVVGAAARRKVAHVAGAPGALHRSLSDWLATVTK